MPDYHKLYKQIIKYEPAIILFAKMADVRYVSLDEFRKSRQPYKRYGSGELSYDVIIYSDVFNSTIECLKVYIPEMDSMKFKWILSDELHIGVFDIPHKLYESTKAEMIK